MFLKIFITTGLKFGIQVVLSFFFCTKTEYFTKWFQSFVPNYRKTFSNLFQLKLMLRRNWKCNLFVDKKNKQTNKKILTYPNGFGCILAIRISLFSHLFLHFLHEALPFLAFSTKNGLSDSSVSDMILDKQN